MNPHLIEALIATGCSWYLSYHQSLAHDDEVDVTPIAHFSVSIIVTDMESAEGWGDTADEAAREALRQIQ